MSGGVDFGTDPAMCERLVADCRAATATPIIAKLTPNVTSIPAIAKAAAAGGADAISLINTCLGMAIDWRRRRPLLGNVLGGLSGPAIKPIALRAVYQAAQAVKTPHHRHRRHRHDRRRDGIPRRRRIGGSTRHRELLQSNGVYGSARRAAGGAGDGWGDARRRRRRHA